MQQDKWPPDRCICNLDNCVCGLYVPDPQDFSKSCLPLPPTSSETGSKKIKKAREEAAAAKAAAAAAAEAAAAVIAPTEDGLILSSSSDGQAEAAAPKRKPLSAAFTEVFRKEEVPPPDLATQLEAVFAWEVARLEAAEKDAKSRRSRGGADVAEYVPPPMEVELAAMGDEEAEVLGAYCELRMGEELLAECADAEDSGSRAASFARAANLLQELDPAEYSHPDSRTPLGCAARAGHTRLVCELISCGVPLDEADADGRTPLWWACEAGHANAAALLLDAGASAAARDAATGDGILAAAVRGASDRAQLAGVVVMLLDRAASAGRPAAAAAAAHRAEQACEISAQVTAPLVASAHALGEEEVECALRRHLAPGAGRVAIGTRIALHSLEGRPHLNGAWGEVVGWEGSMQQYEVKLEPPHADEPPAAGAGSKGRPLFSYRHVEPPAAEGNGGGGGSGGGARARGGVGAALQSLRGEMGRGSAGGDDSPPKPVDPRDFAAPGSVPRRAEGSDAGAGSSRAYDETGRDGRGFRLWLLNPSWMSGQGGPRMPRADFDQDAARLAKEEAAKAEAAKEEETAEPPKQPAKSTPSAAGAAARGGAARKEVESGANAAKRPRRGA